VARMVGREMHVKFWWAMPARKSLLGRRRYKCKNTIRLYLR